MMVSLKLLVVAAFLLVCLLDLTSARRFRRRFRHRHFRRGFYNRYYDRFYDRYPGFYGGYYDDATQDPELDSATELDKNEDRSTGMEPSPDMEDGKDMEDGRNMELEDGKVAVLLKVLPDSTSTGNMKTHKKMSAGKNEEATNNRRWWGVA